MQEVAVTPPRYAFSNPSALFITNASPVKAVYYPKVVPSKPFYDHCRTATGGYGGLLSATFYNTEQAAAFYDNLHTEKGPSLGTNFTLV